jgi:hypothetical protein
MKVCNTCSISFESKRRNVCNSCRNKTRILNNTKERICPSCTIQHIDITNKCGKCKGSEAYKNQKLKTRECSTCLTIHNRPGTLCNQCAGTKDRANNPNDYKNYYKKNKAACFLKHYKYKNQQKLVTFNNLLYELNEFYENCSNKMTVDHIIPLTNKEVCGLNVPWNLQYLSRKENSSKNNYFDGTYENKSWKDRKGNR